MAMLNIPTTVDDPHHRYKMPRLVSKMEGRGCSSKTCILNMGEVAASLRCQPSYCCKFFGYELGAATQEGDRTIIKGHHETKVFQDLLDKFIDKYVLCQSPQCNLPEIDMKVKKGRICAACRACGWEGELDSMHKLANFIIKTSKTDKKDKMDKAKGGERDENKVDDDEKGTVKAKEKKEKEKKEKKEKNEKKEKKEKEKEKKERVKGGESDEKEEEKEKEEGEEEMRKKTTHRKKERKVEPGMEGNDDDKDVIVRKGSRDEDDEEEEGGPSYGSQRLGSAVEAVMEFLKRKGPGVRPDDLLEEIRLHQVGAGFDDSVRMYVLLGALFPRGSMTPEAVAERVEPIRRLACAGPGGGLAGWIGAFDAYLGASPEAAGGYARVLKALYDADIAEEEDLLLHYRAEEGAPRRLHPGFQAAAKAAAPFLKWLEEAEVEEEDDEEEEEEEKRCGSGASGDGH